MSKGIVKKVAGPLVIAENMRDANMFDVVRVGEQRLIAKQMCRNFFLTEESPKNLLFLYRGFTIPVTLQQLFNVLIIHKCLFHHILTGSAFGPGRGLLLPVPRSDA